MADSETSIAGHKMSEFLDFDQPYTSNLSPHQSSVAVWDAKENAWEITPIGHLKYADGSGLGFKDVNGEGYYYPFFIQSLEGPSDRIDMYRDGSYIDWDDPLEMHTWYWEKPAVSNPTQGDGAYILCHLPSDPTILTTRLPALKIRAWGESDPENNGTAYINFSALTLEPRG